MNPTTELKQSEIEQLCNIASFTVNDLDNMYDDKFISDMKFQINRAEHEDLLEEMLTR